MTEQYDREPLMLSGLQHFVFCRRQWALIHIEQAWAENIHTVEGNIFHRNAHDESSIEVRGDKIIMRGLRISSRNLNITGICDVVEFISDPEGISLPNREGCWRVCPVEYKKGAPKGHDADELQLCGQAMCLEEMLACKIEYGYLYYGEPRRRTNVEFSTELRERVKNMLAEMQEYYDRGHTPEAKYKKSCNSCSLKDLCVPSIQRNPAVSTYIQQHIKEVDECENY